MKNMIRSLLVGAMLLGLNSVGTAGDFTLNPSTIPGCGACTSPVGNLFGFTFVGTSFIQNDLGANGVFDAGDAFTEWGALSATSFTSAASTPIAGVLTGLNNNWQLGAIFNGLAGTNTTVGVGNLAEFAFTPGAGTISLYAEPINIANLHDPNNPATIADGTLVAQLEVLSGSGSLDTTGVGTLDGTVNLLARFVNLPVAGFWEKLGLPIDLTTTIFLALTDSNNNVIEAPAGTIGNFDAFFGTTSANNPPVAIYTSNDGSVQFATVPEPSSLILFGFSLLGSAVWVRRRNRKAQ